MDTFWLKAAVLLVLAALVYREILKTASKTDPAPVKKKAGAFSLLSVGAVVGIFTYVGMSVTWIETRDLRPYVPKMSGELVSPFDSGVIELNGMVIKTNLARSGELSELARTLAHGCEGNDGCEAQKLFDYVTAIPYRTDHTSRNALEVVQTNWGDCDDKTNLYASLLNERGIDYRLVYVPHHVFMAVHTRDSSSLPMLAASLTIGGEKYYYAETTAKGARIGEFNGQFPSSFVGVYDLKANESIDVDRVAFRIM